MMEMLTWDRTRGQERGREYCFACMGELMHPRGGFVGGFISAESYESY
jgi:hypothetical protein